MHEIILGGFGGQGIKVISSLLGQAAHRGGRHAAMYNIYAAAIRGGPIFCTVLVDDQPITGAPTTTRPTAVLAMDPNTVRVYERVIRPGGALVINTSLVDERPMRTDLDVVLVPTNEIAEALGDMKYTGMVGLGALIEATGVVTFDTVRACLMETLPSYRHHMISANEEALRRGAACVTRPATAVPGPDRALGGVGGHVGAPHVC